jgi:effector-binding domain-containing protein
MTHEGMGVADARRTPEIHDLAAARTLVVRGRGVPPEGIREFYDGAFTAIGTVMQREHLRPVGPAFALYRSSPGDAFDLEVGFAVDHELGERKTAAAGVAVEASELPGVRAATVSHIGDYAGLPQAWEGLHQWVKENGHTAGLPFWEVYVTEPTPEMDPAKLRTDLYLALG